MQWQTTAQHTHRVGQCISTSHGTLTTKDSRCFRFTEFQSGKVGKYDPIHSLLHLSTISLRSQQKIFTF